MKRFRFELIVVPLLLFVSTFMSCKVQTSSTITTVLPSEPPQVQYEVKYNGSGNGSSYANAMVVDDKGNVYIAGYTSYNTATGYSDYATLKYDSNGKLLWEAIYNGPADGYDSASCLALDSLGNVYVTGSSQGAGTGSDYTTIKYDGNGNQFWVARYNGTGNGDDIASSVTVDSTGVYVTGSSTGTNSGKDFLTLKYDLSGNQLWEARYNGPENGDDFAYSLAIDKSGNVYVTGMDNGIAGEEGGSSYIPQLTIPGKSKGYFATLKYDSNGKQLWEAGYKGTGNGDDIARAVRVDATGNVYVTGESMNSDTGYGYATIKYNSSGKQLWAVRYEGTVKGNDGAFAMALDESGDILVTGYSSGVVNEIGVREYATIKYDSNGNQLWAELYSGPYGDNIAYSIATDSAGSVYVTGVSGFIKYDSTAYENYATVKYDKNGSQLWVVRYSDGQGSNNIAKALALDALGNIYVTGINIQNGADYNTITTIKYVQKEQ